MWKFSSSVAVVCGLALSGSALAAADYSDTPVFGGGGGGSFRAYCPQNTYLIGIGGRTGSWIDAIQPICAQWNASTQAFNPPVAGNTSGGSGGGPATLMCPAGMVVRGWEIARTTTGKAWVVQSVSPKCEAFRPEQRASAQPGRFGGNGATEASNLMSYRCPQGQFANGIYGASGAYVDNAGLSCDAQPVMIGQPTPAGEPAKTIGRVPNTSGPAGPARSICEAARDARARNSPAAPNLEAQCLAAGERPPPPATTVPAVQPPLVVDSGSAQTPPRATGVTYNSPMIVAANGQTVMLDFCRDFGSACGKPAADAFCRQKGHPNASRFQISEDIGHTAIISTGAICDEPHCDGFTKIQCNPDTK